MKLLYSQEAANRIGYAIAKLSNGLEVKYTNLVSDNYDKPEFENQYKWKDKVTNYQGKDSDIISNDYTNFRNNKHINLYDHVPLDTEINKLILSYKIANIRETSLFDKKLLDQSKKPLK